ncbi:hypothetical protein, partial [Escherichia coli]|uniref:hypothetical protein n=1 Tax=Escherichia coli TaxID=562 RepID=UPI001BC8B7DF
MHLGTLGNRCDAGQSRSRRQVLHALDKPLERRSPAGDIPQRVPTQIVTATVFETAQVQQR